MDSVWSKPLTEQQKLRQTRLKLEAELEALQKERQAAQEALLDVQEVTAEILEGRRES